MDTDRPLETAELEVLWQEFVIEAPQVVVQTKFNYAWGLLRSTKKEHAELALSLLSEIYTDNPERRRECLYYLALGNYKIDNFLEARRYIERLLQVEPAHGQAKKLNCLVNVKAKQEHITRIAIMGSAITASIVLAAVLFRRSAA